MRIVAPEFSIDLVCDHKNPVTCVIENRSIFSGFTYDLWQQGTGRLGSVILSENDNILDFDKTAEVILNPFAVNLNDKKILAALYKELKEIGTECYYEQVFSLNSYMVDLIDTIGQHIDYKISFDMDLDLKNIFKLYNVKLDEESDDILYRLLSYVKCLHRICGTKLVIVVNLQMYLDRIQIQEFFKECRYEEIAVLDIEAVDFGKHENENYVIIDKDMCTIEL